MSKQPLLLVVVLLPLACRAPRPATADPATATVTGALSGVTSVNLQLQVSKNACVANQAQDYFKVTNSSAASVPLSKLAIKYWINDTSGGTPAPQIWYGGCVTAANGTCLHPVSGVTAKVLHLSPGCGPDAAHQASWEITIATTDTTPLAVGQSWSNLQTAINLSSYANFTPGTATWFSGCGAGKPYAPDPAFAVYDDGDLVNTQGVSVPACRTPEVLRIQTFIEQTYYATSDIVSSFEASPGEQIDCIDFFAQHSVKAWLAKGVTIPSTPPPAPPRAANEAPPNMPPGLAFTGQPDRNGHPRQCTGNQVAVSRPTVAQIQAAGGLDAFKQQVLGRKPRLVQDDRQHDCWLNADPAGGGLVPGVSSDAVNWDHAVGLQRGNWLPAGAPGYMGMKITAPIYEPFMDPLGPGHSDVQLWAQTGDCDNFYNSADDVKAGESKNPCRHDATCTSCLTNGGDCHGCAVQSMEVAALTSGNDVPRLTAFFTSDGYFTNYCLAQDPSCAFCPTVSITVNDPTTGAPTTTQQGTNCWVQWPGATLRPGVQLDRDATGHNIVAPYGQPPIEIEFRIWNGSQQSAATAGWWVYVADNLIGWYPPNTFDWPDGSPGPMANGPATYLQAGGEVLNTWPIENGVPRHSNTAMVSENSAFAGYGYASYVRNVSYFDASQVGHDAELQYVVTPAYEKDAGMAGLCALDGAGWSDSAAAFAAYSIAPRGLVAPGGAGWGQFLYFGGGITAREKPAGCQSPAYQPGQIVEIPLPPELVLAGESPTGPHSLDRGPDCNLYAADGAGYWKIGTDLSTTRTIFANFDPAQSFINNVVGGPDGNLWLSEILNGNRPVVLRIDPATGETTGSFPLDVLFDQIGPLALGPDARLWFPTNKLSLGGLTTDGVPALINVPAPPVQAVAGPDGNLWFSTIAFGGALQVGRVPPSGAAGTTATMFNVPAPPGSIALGVDGNIWVTAHNFDQIFKIDRDGSVTEFGIGGTIPRGIDAITAGPDGAVWFTEDFTNAIGRITPNGTIQEFPLPTPPAPLNTIPAITTGPDGNIWFVENENRKIGRITPPQPQ
jgi:streptogramin lyase